MICYAKVINVYVDTTTTVGRTTISSARIFHSDPTYVKAKSQTAAFVQTDLNARVVYARGSNAPQPTHEQPDKVVVVTSNVHLVNANSIINVSNRSCFYT